MATPVAGIEFVLRARGEGLEAYTSHSEGLRTVGRAQRDTSTAMQSGAESVRTYSQSLHALSFSLHAATGAIKLFAGENEQINKIMSATTTIVSTASSALSAYRNVSRITAASEGGRAASGAAGNVWAAPLAAAIAIGAAVSVAGALKGLGAFHSGGVVPESGPYLLERGETVVPASPAQAARATPTLVRINMTAQTVDPSDPAEAQRIARLIAQHQQRRLDL